MSRLLDRLAHPVVRVGGRDVSSFRLFGFAGIAVGVTVAEMWAWLGHLSVGVTTAFVVLAVLTSVALLVVTTLVTGQESLVFYHHAASATLVLVLVCVLSGEPVRRYTDLVAVAFCVLLAFGRIGCLMAGCCHGRPARSGVCYTTEHVVRGVPESSCGVRLVPVQGYECLLALLIAAVAASTHGPPGTRTSTVLVSYSIARLIVDDLRADRDTQLWLGFSHAQWTSVALLLLALLARAGNVLPRSRPQDALTLMAAAVFVFAVGRRSRESTAAQTIRHPRSLRELVHVLRAAEGGAPGDSPVVLRTPSGWLVSRGTNNVSVSHVDGVEPDCLKALSSLVANVVGRWATCVERQGVLHFLYPASSCSRRPRSA